MTIKVNDNAEQAALIREKIKKNGGYCICALRKDENHRCGPCAEFINSEEDGWCHCHLYYKTQN